MANKINRECPFCGEKLTTDSYKVSKGIEFIAYCDNENCDVQPCTDATTPSKVFAEILSFGAKLKTERLLRR